MKKRYQDMAQSENACHRANGEALFWKILKKIKNCLKEEIKKIFWYQKNITTAISNLMAKESN